MWTYAEVAASGDGLTRYLPLSTRSNAPLVSDLLRSDATAVAPFLPRLEAPMQPLSAAEAGMAKVLRMDAVLWVTWLQHGDAVVPLFPEISPQWWHTLMPFFYGPRETANLHTSQSALRRKAAEARAPQYLDAMAETMRQAQALTPHGPANHLVNPVGRGALDAFSAGDAISIMPYAARVHGTQGLYALVALQLKLRATGAATPEAVTIALADSLGTTRPDPYTAKPMSVDPKTNSIGFESKSKSGAVAQEMKERFGGRVAIAL